MYHRSKGQSLVEEFVSIDGLRYYKWGTSIVASRVSLTLTIPDIFGFVQFFLITYVAHHHICLTKNQLSFLYIRTTSKKAKVAKNYFCEKKGFISSTS